MAAGEEEMTEAEGPSTAQEVEAGGEGDDSESVAPMAVDLPSAVEQRETIKALWEQHGQLMLGQTWNALAGRWWEAWKRYVGYEDPDSPEVGSEVLHPGPIKNEMIASKDAANELRRDLVSEISTVPGPVWSQLSSWYTLSNPEYVFPRRVVGFGNQLELRVELFPYFVRLSKVHSRVQIRTSKEEKGPSVCFDSTRPVKEVMAEVCQVMKVEASRAQVLVVSPRGNGEELSNEAESKASPAKTDLTKLVTDNLTEHRDKTLGDLYHQNTQLQIVVVDTTWRYELKVGDRVDVQDTDGGWYDSEVIEVKNEGNIRIHFRCWESKWDEDFARDDDRIQPLFTWAPNWRTNWHKGMKLEVKIKEGGPKWFEGEVLEVDTEKGLVKVASSNKHDPQSKFLDKWVGFDSEEICRSGVHIKPKVKNKDSPPASYPASSYGSSGSNSRTISTRSSSYYDGGAYSYRNNTRGVPPVPGAVGLSNLGNTCFMNSMLQCLSNTQILTQYFLNRRHEGEINHENVLGTRGRLAQVYAKLLEDMWCGDFVTVVPTDFKRVIGQFAPQFAGYQQHDSQELMSFLLDGLHEDLNRVKHKPYIEARDYDGRADVEVACESWRNHVKRNDSVVVDYCQGLLKSHVTCPNCGYNSVTFDPYLSLSLPLPVVNTVKVPVQVVRLPRDQKPIKAIANLPANATVRDLKEWVSKRVLQPAQKNGGDSMMMDDLPAPVLDVWEVAYDKRLISSREDKELVNKAVRGSGSTLAVYQFECDPSTTPGAAVVVVMFMKQSSNRGLNFMNISRPSNDRTGFPFVMAVTPDTTNREVHQRLWDWTSRVVDDSLNDQPPGFNFENNRPYTVYLTNTVGTSTDTELQIDDEPFLSTCGNNLSSPAASYTSSSSSRPPINLMVLFTQNEMTRVDLQQLDDTTPHSSLSDSQDCLNKFVEREQLGVDDLWYCTKCKQRLQAYKKMDIWSVPDVLILHLKRFSYIHRYYTVREKIEDLVNFPITGLDLSNMIKGPINPSAPPIYDLYAVSEHSGGLGGGHYTATAKNFRDSKWYSFNDSHCSLLPGPEDVVRPQAYVLFFRRRTGSLRWAGVSSEGGGT